MDDVKDFLLDFWEFIKFPFTSECEYVYQFLLWLTGLLFSLLFFPFMFLGCLFWAFFHIRLRGRDFEKDEVSRK